MTSLAVEIGMGDIKIMHAPRGENGVAVVVKRVGLGNPMPCKDFLVLRGRQSQLVSPSKCKHTTWEGTILVNCG
jgi:hypothetical protein